MFMEEKFRVKVDTADRMIKDCASTGKVSWSSLERLQNRIEKSLRLWSARALEFGQHKRSCPEGPSHQSGLCTCGFDKVRQEAKKLQPKVCL